MKLKSRTTAERRHRLLPFLVLLPALALVGCRNDMHNQPKYEPYEASTFFADGSSNRLAPAHTVARGTLDPTDPGDQSWRVDQNLASYHEPIMNRNFFKPPNQVRSSAT